jgi:hypothetical protein
LRLYAEQLRSSGFPPKTFAPVETEAREYLAKTFAAVEAAYASIALRRAVEIAEIVRAPDG